MVNAYDFAEQLLTSQRKFAGESQNVIEATKPLLGGEEGPAAKKGDAEQHPACAANGNPGPPHICKLTSPPCPYREAYGVQFPERGWQAGRVYR